MATSSLLGFSCAETHGVPIANAATKNAAFALLPILPPTSPKSVKLTLKCQSGRSILPVALDPIGDQQCQPKTPEAVPCSCQRFCSPPASQPLAPLRRAGRRKQRIAQRLSVHLGAPRLPVPAGLRFGPPDSWSDGETALPNLHWHARIASLRHSAAL